METIKSWNKFYDDKRRSQPLVWPDIEAVKLLSRALTRLPPPEACTALDLACGEGRNTRLLLECGITPRCLDSSGHALDILQQIYGIGQEKLICSEAEAYLVTLINESIDLILCWGLSHYIDDFSIITSHINRVLKRDGLLIASFSSTDDDRPRAAEPAKLYTEAEVLSLVKDHNFEIIEFGHSIRATLSQSVTESFYYLLACKR